MPPATRWIISAELCRFPIPSCFRPASHPLMAAFLSCTFSGAGEYGQGKLATDEQRQINLVDNLSVSKASHQLKFGVDYRWLAPFSSPFSYQQFVEFSGSNGNTGRRSFRNGSVRPIHFLSSRFAAFTKCFAVWARYLEDHIPINIDLWLEVGHQSSPEGEEPRERSLHSVGPG